MTFPKSYFLSEVTTVMMRNLPNKYTQQMLSWNPAFMKDFGICWLWRHFPWDWNATKDDLPSTNQLSFSSRLTISRTQINHSTLVDLALRLGELRDAGFHMQVRAKPGCGRCKLPLTSDVKLKLQALPWLSDCRKTLTSSICRASLSLKGVKVIKAGCCWGTDRTLCHQKSPTYVWNRRANFSLPNGLRAKHTCHRT